MQHSTQLAQGKRSRDDGEESPEKRVRTWSNENDVGLRQPDQLPPAVPTLNFDSELAKQKQRMFEQMLDGTAEREDVEMGGDDGGHEMGGDEGLVSNPIHPWSRMERQNSNSSSSFASADSSMPSTPLDLAFNEQGQQESFYPIPAAQAARASHHTSSFTDHNGTTHVFSSSPPLSVYPPPANSPSDLYVSNPMESAPFPMHAWGAKSAPTTTSGVLRMGAGEPEVIRELHHPAPAWNGFRQASTYGSHMM